MLPVAQRPPGYSPLGEKNLDPDWIACLSQSGKDCYEAIVCPGCQSAGSLHEFVHDVLGEDPPEHGSASRCSRSI